jgi:UDP-N-acetylglucosamine--N-acetylmuramyl-(pentapeptide) pyrophosphoryl-undecaprenol N-acetylglucosamine transferase
VALQESYRNLISDVKLFSFLKEINYAYSVADLVVSRAGATTISEIIFFQLPAIIIPYPYAGRHQWQNAKVLEKNKTAFIIKEEELVKDSLKKILVLLLSQPERISKMRSGYDFLSVSDAAGLLSDEAQRLLCFSPH